MGHGQGTKLRGSSFVVPASWTPNLGLLGLFAKSERNWLEGWGWMLVVNWGLDLRRVMDCWRQWKVILFGYAARPKKGCDFW